jgi:alpha-L-fucosidase
MSTPPTTKRNGKGKQVMCPNGVECEVAQSAADTLSLIDARFTRVEESLARLHTEALDFRQAVLESHEQVLKSLRRMEERDA